MSDVPLPPPPSGRSPVPPPPPPDLRPPPGYAGYTTGPIGSVPLKRIGGVSRAAMILVGIAAATTAISVVIGRSVSDDAETYLAGGTDSEEFIEAIAPYLLFSFVQFIAVLASAVVVIIWMYRIAANHRTLHRNGTWGPGWAIGGWFLPPLVYVIPFLMFRELWKASDPAVPIGGEWRSGTATPLVTAWFVTYSVLPLVALALQGDDLMSSLGASERDLAEQLTGDQTGTYLSAAITVLGAIVFIAMARGLTDRHRRLTGEHQG